MNQRLDIGRVLSTHGVRGEVKVKSLSGQRLHFVAGMKYQLSKNGKTQLLQLNSIRGALPNLIASFEGYDNPEASRLLNGWVISIERSEAAEPQEGEYYYADLIGCALVFNGMPLGEVVDIWENSNCEMFEVRKSDGSLVQVPFQEPFIGDVDIENRRITLKVEWILE